MVKIAIMGVGGWGENHAKKLAQLRAEELIEDFIAIDIDSRRAKYISKLYGCKAYTTLDEALRKEELDGIIIATPTPLHYQHTKKALENGLHVLVEKPMTTTSKEALELIELAKQNNKILMTGFLLRYSPAVQFVREKLKQNPKYFGEILMVSTRRVNPWRIREWDVGVIKDLVIHDADLVAYIFNAEPIRAYANIKTMGHKIELSAVGFVEYENKWDRILLTFEASWISPQKFRRWTISGTEREAKLDLVNHTIEIYTQKETVHPLIPRGPDPLYRQDRNFVEAIKKKNKPLVTGFDGYIALKTCEALLESAEKGKIIEIYWDE